MTLPPERLPFLRTASVLWKFSATGPKETEGPENGKLKKSIRLMRETFMRVRCLTAAYEHYHSFKGEQLESRSEKENSVLSREQIPFRSERFCRAAPLTRLSCYVKSGAA